MEKIICLVRADTDDVAAERVFVMADKRGLAVEKSKIEVYAADLAADKLGLRDEVYAGLVDAVDEVIHVSATAMYVDYADGRRPGLYISPAV